MSSGAATILLVEDDPDIRGALAELLEAEGYEVLAAANGRRALELLERTRGQACLVLLDLVMPVMSGTEFLAVKERAAAIAPIPVVLVSASTEGAEHTAREHGVPLVRKPIRIDLLLSLVEEYCGERAAGYAPTQPSMH